MHLTALMLGIWLIWGSLGLPPAQSEPQSEPQSASQSANKNSGGCTPSCLSNKQGKVFALKPLQFHYEIDGHFDKDEQGWCASRIEIQIWPNGEVLLRDWYDANGHILSDLHYRGHVIAQYGQTLTLQLEGRGFQAHLGVVDGRVELDLQTGRLKTVSD